MGLFRGLPARFPLKACHWQPFRALQAPKPHQGGKPRPWPAGPPSLKMIHWIIFRALRAPGPGSGG